MEGVKLFYWFARFPVARYKMEENGNHRVEFYDLRFGNLETIDESYFLVTANLRLPTLKKISPILRKIVSPEGFMVISGVRSHKTDALIDKYATKGFEKLWMENEHDWAGIVFQHSK